METAPTPPEGYRNPTEYDETDSVKEQLLTTKGILLTIAQIVLFAGGALVVGLELSDLTTFERQFGPIAFLILFIGSFYGTTVVHEYVHWIVDRVLGYDPVIRWELFNPYVIMPNRMVRRGDNIVSLLSPFFAINMAALLLILANFNSVLTLISQIVFVTNTAGAVGDLRGAFYLFRCPVGTRIWLTDEDGRQSFTYEPETVEETA